MKFLILILLLTSCYSGLNYVVGNSHNSQKANRERIVMDYDKFSKKQMIKQRKRSSRAIKKEKKIRIHRRLIR
jgi:hypothetical protein